MFWDLIIASTHFHSGHILSLLPSNMSCGNPPKHDRDRHAQRQHGVRARTMGLRGKSILNISCNYQLWNWVAITATKMNLKASGGKDCCSVILLAKYKYSFILSQYGYLSQPGAPKSSVEFSRLQSHHPQCLPCWHLHLSESLLF